MADVAAGGPAQARITVAARAHPTRPVQPGGGADTLSAVADVARDVFAEPDPDRLRSRLAAVTAGDLSDEEVERLAGGDLALVEDLPLTAQQGVRALVVADSEAAGALEKMVGVSIDYVPVAYLDLARMAANAVARVVDGARNAVGTGTLVSPRLFLTNHHVTPDAAEAARQVLQFDYELEVEGTPRLPTEFALDPEAIFWTSPKEKLDATLVAVGKRLSGARSLGDFGHCPLSGASDKHAQSDFVTVVQHPEGQYKQIALRENQVIGRGKGGVTLHYGADTLPGSSGSPVFNDQFELVALHHAGGRLNETRLEDGSAVPEESNEGIRISAVVTALRGVLDATSSPARGLLAEALDPPSDGPRLSVPAPEEAADRLPGAGGVVTAGLPSAGGWVHTDVAVPVRVALRSPEPAALTPEPTQAPRPDVAVPAGAVERNQPPDPRYGRRRGYDPDFLCLSVPLPRLSADQLELAAVPKERQRKAEDLPLAYLHFSVVMNGERRIPFLTAVNIDGARARGINRQTGEVEAAETWFVDPRLDDDEQLAQSLFERQRPRPFDRGHMVRRLDPAWGSAQTARRASDDTFHFTNCSPQISAFNQRATLWAGIEDYVLDNAKAERQKITVFTGPFFADDDPVFRDVAIPRAFWKVLVRMQDRRLRCTAFRADQGELLDRALEAGVEAFADLGRAGEFQVPVAQVAEETGLDFGELPAADTSGAEAVAGVRLSSLDEVDW